MTEQQSRPEFGRDITEADYLQWKHHPVTKAMFAYFRDYASAVERDTVARWLATPQPISHEQEARGRILTLREIVDLPFEAMITFYQQVQEENATQVDQNRSR